MDDLAGTAFPFAIDEATGGIAWSNGAAKIRENVRIILGTRYGERPLLREFGTKVQSLVHDPNDAVLADLLKNQVQESLLRFEPRILVTQVLVEQDADAGELRLRLFYTFTTEAGINEMLIPLR
jgi:phage baseplate assembly protein W